MSPLLTAALEARVVGIALTGPYGHGEHYGEHYVPRKMRETYGYTSIPTDDARKIIRWKTREIEVSANRTCAWAIALKRDYWSPGRGPRAAASMESIIAAAAEVGPLYVLMVAGGAATRGKEPISTWFSPAVEEGFWLDVEAEASERGTSLLFDQLEVVPPNPPVQLRYARYAVYSAGAIEEPLAVRFSNFVSFSVARRLDTELPIMREREVIGVGRLAPQLCGTTEVRVDGPAQRLAWRDRRRERSQPPRDGSGVHRPDRMSCVQTREVGAGTDRQVRTPPD